MSTLSGIESLTSTSTEGHSSVEVTFSLETDSGQAAQDVRDQLASVTAELPEAAETPWVIRFNPLAAPVLSLAISSPGLDQGALTRSTRDVIVPTLTAVDGVGSATLVGAVDRQIEVGIDLDRLRAEGVGVADLMTALQDDNLLSPAGSIEAGTGIHPVLLNSEATIPELEEPIAAKPGGVQPLAIMASLPLAFSGVVLGLLAGGSTVSLYSMIGVVILIWLAVKNAILLGDNANQHERAGLLLHEALLVAGVTRFRPIMMTTLAMIFGMLPLAVALHPGGEQRASMAQAVIGGLVTSTLLTLVVVPVILIYVDRLARWLRSHFPDQAPRATAGGLPRAAVPGPVTLPTGSTARPADRAASIIGSE